jgi:DNA-binding beta-propeller fold protein YncE
MASREITCGFLQHIHAETAERVALVVGNGVHLFNVGRWMLVFVALAAICACGARNPAQATDAPLALEKMIPLPGVQGRIDHLAYDPKGRRLFIAELGNGSVEVIDLATGKSLARLSRLHEPQGVAWLDRTRELAVASADGTVRFYGGDRFQPTATLIVGDDADDLRVDPRSGALIVGYGGGALAMIDPVRHQVVRRLPLAAHPEGFQLDSDTVYVNLPDNGSIVMGRPASGTVTARWSTGLRRLNFPMALDSVRHTLAVAFRLPARLMLMNTPSGTVRQVLSTCGDSDDLFFDPKRALLEVICGSGEIDVYRHSASDYALIARVPSRAGARTGLFVPQEDRLYVAARARGSTDADVLVFRPAP